MNHEQCEELLGLVKNLSRGNTDGPLGMEAITMALCGEGPPGQNISVAEGLMSISSSLDRLADALEVRE